MGQFQRCPCHSDQAKLRHTRHVDASVTVTLPAAHSIVSKIYSTLLGALDGEVTLETQVPLGSTQSKL
jgi:hypothetical protein